MRAMRARTVLGICCGAMVLTFVAPAAAGAQTVNPYGGGSTVVTDPATVSATASAPDAPADPGHEGSLPFTGGDVAGVAAIGAVTVAAGMLAARVRRQHQRI
jgi:hypothetical protein